MKVTSIDSILISDGKYRKTLNFDMGYQWIEGIGTVSGLLYNEYSCCTCMFITQTVCFKQNDTVLYVNPNVYGDIRCFKYITSVNDINKEDFITISPNPASSEIQVISHR